MKKTLPWVVAAWLSLASTIKAEPLSAEDFSHESAFKDLSLSPDGKILAYAETIKGEHRIYLLDLETNKKLGLELLGFDKSFAHSSSFFWANNRRFVYFTPRTGTYTAIDRDGRNGRSNIPGGRLVHLFRDEQYGKMLMTGQDIAKGEGMGGNVAFFTPNRPFVQEINPSLVSGISSGLEANNDWGPEIRVVENPGGVVGWVATAEGEVKAAKEIKGTKYHTLYRESGKSAWAALPGLDWSDPEAYPLGFSADGATLYVGRVSPEGTWGIYPYDLAKRSLGEAIIAHKKYDIVNPESVDSANGVPQQALIYSPKDRRLLGVRYVTEFPRVFWLDEGLAEVQTALDQALPRKINTITSMSDDLQRLIVLSWTSQDPGTYYLFDRGTLKLEKLMARMPWIDATQMAEKKAIRFKARDGVVINGYLTLPPGKGPANLPLVVLPHDATWGRYVWGFDASVQFLASRGYAVLQINHRGSAGYGERFRGAADKQAGRLTVADLADGARWAIGQKTADPARIGIVGFGKLAGNYCLLSLATEPELYCCGVDNGGFTDWSRSMDKSRIMPDFYAAWIEKFGDPVDSGALLTEISPLNNAAKIKAPVLVMHDKQDENWTYNQSKDMVAALKQAGRPVEFIDNYDEKYGYLTAAKYMTDTMAFLQKHMPADR